MQLLLILGLMFYWAAAADVPVPEKFNSPEGIKRFQRSEYKADFFALANYYLPQPYNSFCGPATGAIILNALRMPMDEKKKDLPFTRPFPGEEGHDVRRYSTDNFLNEKTELIKKRSDVLKSGLALKQLHQMFEAHNTDASVHPMKAPNFSSEELKALIDNMDNPKNFVAINYQRSGVDPRRSGGHISPLAAYDAESDSFLIMDVNPANVPWVWVKSSDLAASMNTDDHGTTRGYVVIQDK